MIIWRSKKLALHTWNFYHILILFSFFVCFNEYDVWSVSVNNMQNFLAEQLHSWLSVLMSRVLSYFSSDPSPIISTLVTNSLTDWLTDYLTPSCLVEFIDVTLACEDANSKLVEVADVEDEDHVGPSLLQIWELMFCHKAKLLFRLWAQVLVKILKLKFRQDFEAGFYLIFWLTFCRGYEV